MEVIGTLILLGLIIGAGPQDQDLGILDCERVDMGGYYNFADPDCAAEFTGGADDQDTPIEEEEEIEEEVAEES